MEKEVSQKRVLAIVLPIVLVPVAILALYSSVKEPEQTKSERAATECRNSPGNLTECLARVEEQYWSDFWLDAANTPDESDPEACEGGASVCFSNEERLKSAASSSEAFLWDSRSGYRAEVLQEFPDEVLLTMGRQPCKLLATFTPEESFSLFSQGLASEDLAVEQEMMLTDLYALGIKHICPEYAPEGF